MHLRDIWYWGLPLAFVVLTALVIAVVRRGRSPAGRHRHRRRGLLMLLAWPGLWARTAAAAGAQEAERPGATTGTAPLARLRLHNVDRDAEQAADFVSPMFGNAFRQGDIPRGTWPRFVLADGTPCPATLWGVTSWPDGSMKFCAAMVRVPARIAPDATLEFHVLPGGTAPPKGPRSVKDLLQADIAVELDGTTALAGRWTASLNDGIRDAKNVVLVGSGPAGTVWRIGAEFRDGSRAAHGQLYCWHYVAALNGRDDEMLGLRYLGRVAQPWTDVEKPAPCHREFSATLRTGQRVIRQLLGHATTETPGEVIRLPHYASFFTAGPQARWDYIPGTLAQDGSVRISIDAESFVRSRLLPPYDLRVPIDKAPETAYHPMGRGTTMRAMGTTGEREDIGILPEWNVRHLLAQTAGHETVARVNAMAAAGWRLAFRKHATFQPVPCVDLKPRYAGLGAPELGWRGYSHMAGMVKPAPNDSLWREDTAHRPGSVYWPYLFSGEPQYLDLLTEQAFAHVLDLNQGNGSVWGTTFPRKDVLEGPWRGERGIRIGDKGKLYKGSGVLLHGTGGTRMTAWRTRDIVQAAALAPDIAPDGSAAREYLRDVMDSSYAAFHDYMSKVPASYRDSGLFIQSKANGAPWQVAYLSWSVCHQADILGTPEAARVRSHLSRFWSSFAEHADIGCLVAYICTYLHDNGNLVTSTAEVLGSLDSRLSFQAASSRVHVEASKSGSGGSWTPHDGDAFQFYRKRSPEIAPLLGDMQARRLYAVNCSGQSFQLAPTPGGNPITIGEDATTSNFFARLKDFSPDLSFSTTNAPSGYLANIHGAVAHHLACGDAVEEVKAQLDRIVDGRHVRFNNNPKYCVARRRD